MKIISQWQFGDSWGISLFTVFSSGRYYGFVILGILFEWERKQ